jgi:hypothetical protein
MFAGPGVWQALDSHNAANDGLGFFPPPRKAGATPENLKCCGFRAWTPSPPSTVRARQSHLRRPPGEEEHRRLTAARAAVAGRGGHAMLWLSVLVCVLRM